MALNLFTFCYSFNELFDSLCQLMKDGGTNSNGDKGSKPNCNNVVRLLFHYRAADFLENEHMDKEKFKGVTANEGKRFQNVFTDWFFLKLLADEREIKTNRRSGDDERIPP